MKRVSIFLTICFVLTTFLLSAQSQVIVSKKPYTSAIGLKFFPAAVSLKHYVSAKRAIDLYAYFNEGTRITGLYEFNGSLSNSGNLQWYVGPGAHVHFYDFEHGGGVNIGADAIFGLEYKLQKLPIAISIDWQPSIEFSSKSTFAGGWGGIGGKFTF